MRARQTAKIIKEELYNEEIIPDIVVEDPRLVEQDYGDFDFRNHRSIFPDEHDSMDCGKYI